MFESRASSFLIGFSKTGYLQKILWHLSLLLPFFCITKNWHKRRALNKKEGKIQTVNFQRETENIKEERDNFQLLFRILNREDYFLFSSWLFADVAGKKVWKGLPSWTFFDGRKLGNGNDSRLGFTKHFSYRVDSDCFQLLSRRWCKIAFMSELLGERKK